VVVGLCGAVTGWVTAPYPRGVDGVSRPRPGGGLVCAASLPLAGAAAPLGWTGGQEVVQVKVGVPGVPLAWNPNVVDPPAGITPL